MRKPRRHTDARVADYWLTHDSVGEIDWSRPGVRLEFDPDVERPTRSVSDVAQQLLEEAMRARECPGIYFAEEPAGRTAKIMGTGLGVWEVIRDYVAGTTSSATAMRS